MRDIVTTLKKLEAEGYKTLPTADPHAVGIKYGKPDDVRAKIYQKMASGKYVLRFAGDIKYVGKYFKDM